MSAWLTDFLRGYLQQPTSCTRQDENALNDSKSEDNFDELFIDFFTFHNPHPLLGPFGAMMGKTMPTTPKMAVKMRNGRAPIVNSFSYLKRKDLKKKYSITRLAGVRSQVFKWRRKILMKKVV